MFGSSRAGLSLPRHFQGGWWVLACILPCSLLVGTTRAAPAAVQGRLEALEFTSDHRLLCRNSTDLLTGGERFPTVAWTRQPAVNAPITHTGGAAVQLRALLTLTLTGVERPTPGLLVGLSQEPGLCFRQEIQLTAQASQAIELTASKPLGRAVRKIGQPIQWYLTLQAGTTAARTLDLGRTGPHIIYVTLGTPRGTDEQHGVVTEARMELAVRRVAAAQAKAGATASGPWLVYELMCQNGSAYLPGRHYARAQAWRVPESWRLDPPGASCISIVEFVVLLGNLIGVEGELRMAAFHARPPDARQALRGGLGDPPLKKKGPNNEPWQLFLVDDTNTRKGQVGGRDGMNYYEAALAYTWRGKTYYYPGGTNRVYDDPDKVLLIFRTLAWAAFDWEQDAWVVREVVETYSRDGDPLARSVPLPP